MDWDDPAARFHLIESVGADEYTRLQQEEFKRQTVEIINGFSIRKVRSLRFGLMIYMVDGLGRGHSTLEGARKIARGEL